MHLLGFPSSKIFGFLLLILRYGYFLKTKSEKHLQINSPDFLGPIVEIPLIALDKK